MIHFGTGGWRAIIGDEFTKANIQKLALALAMKMKAEGADQKGIVAGYDRRFLSKEAIYWSCEVLAEQGIKTWFVNRSSPTPLIMYYVMKHELPYGIMVTASHNPALYNGIKVFTEGGRDADEIQTEDIEKYLAEIEEKQIPIQTMEYQKAIEQELVVEFNPMNEYLDNIIAQIRIDEIRQKSLRVLIDPMYGVSELPLRTLLAIARCDVKVIHDEHDTLFGGKLPAPSAETLRVLQNNVVDFNWDIGIATDGDADRLGVIDDTGKFLHPNEILVFLYYYLTKYRGWRGAAVRNIATTHLLDRVAETFGQPCYEVPVGFKYISAKMQETGAIIGGESSGGLTVHGHIHGKDGVYAAMLLVEMIAVTGKKLSQISEDIKKEFGSYYMEERSYRFHPNRKEEIFNRLMIEKELPQFTEEVEKVSYLDGCKVYFKNGGWIIARFSGTEPLLRIFCEMSEKKESQKLSDNFAAFLELE